MFNPEEELVHSSLGAGKLLQAGYLVQILTKFGFKNITINAIDPLSKKIGLPEIPSFLKSYGEKELWEKKMLENPKRALPSNIFISALYLPEQVNIELKLFDSVHDYLSQLDKGAKKSHSFDMIDIGIVDCGFIHVFKNNLNELNEELINSYDTFNVYGYRGYALEINFIPKHPYFIVNLNVGGVDHSKQKNNIFLIEFIKNLENNNELHNPYKLLQHLAANQEQLIKMINPDEKPTWLGSDLQDWFRIDYYQHPWTNFEKLIDLGKAVDFPVIFEGIGSEGRKEPIKIFQHHMSYTNEKFTPYFGKTNNVRNVNI